MSKNKLTYRDHFGRNINLDDVVVFAAVKKNSKTEKKDAELCCGIVTELVDKNGQPSVKITDPVTDKISHIRRLENTTVIATRKHPVEPRLPKAFEETEAE